VHAASIELKGPFSWRGRIVIEVLEKNVIEKEGSNEKMDIFMKKGGDIK